MIGLLVLLASGPVLAPASPSVVLPDPKKLVANVRGPQPTPSNRPPLLVVKSNKRPAILCCSRAAPPQPKKPR